MKNKISSFVILCENAFASENDKKLNLINIFDGINSEGFPALQPNMAIAIKFEAENGAHKEFARIYKDDIEVARVPEVNIEVKNNRHQVVHILSNVVFPEAGKYKVEVNLDGLVAGFVFLDVNKI